VPWSFFDLAEIRLYEGSEQDFLEFARQGTEAASQAWQVRTFRDSLQPLVSVGIELPGLKEGITMLEERAKSLE
jgi:hypothetical protein